MSGHPVLLLSRVQTRLAATWVFPNLSKPLPHVLVSLPGGGVSDSIGHGRPALLGSTSRETAALSKVEAEVLPWKPGSPFSVRRPPAAPAFFWFEGREHVLQQLFETRAMKFLCMLLARRQQMAGVHFRCRPSAPRPGITNPLGPAVSARGAPWREAIIAAAWLGRVITSARMDRVQPPGATLLPRFRLCPPGPRELNCPASAWHERSGEPPACASI